MTPVTTRLAGAPKPITTSLGFTNAVPHHNGVDPLHWAAIRGDVACVTTLLRHSAQIDIVRARQGLVVGV